MKDDPGTPIGMGANRASEDKGKLPGALPENNYYSHHQGIDISIVVQTETPTSSPTRLLDPSSASFGTNLEPNSSKSVLLRPSAANARISSREISKTLSIPLEHIHIDSNSQPAAPKSMEALLTSPSSSSNASIAYADQKNDLDSESSKNNSKNNNSICSCPFCGSSIDPLAETGSLSLAGLNGGANAGASPIAKLLRSGSQHTLIPSLISQKQRLAKYSVLVRVYGETASEVSKLRKTVEELTRKMESLVQEEKIKFQNIVITNTRLHSNAMLIKDRNAMHAEIQAIQRELLVQQGKLQECLQGQSKLILEWQIQQELQHDENSRRQRDLQEHQKVLDEKEQSLKALIQKTREQLKMNKLEAEAFLSENAARTRPILSPQNLGSFGRALSNNAFASGNNSSKDMGSRHPNNGGSKPGTSSLNKNSASNHSLMSAASTVSVLLGEDDDDYDDYEVDDVGEQRKDEEKEEEDELEAKYGYAAILSGKVGGDSAAREDLLIKTMKMEESRVKHLRVLIVSLRTKLENREDEILKLTSSKLQMMERIEYLEASLTALQDQTGIVVAPMDGFAHGAIRMTAMNRTTSAAAPTGLGHTSASSTTNGITDAKRQAAIDRVKQDQQKQQEIQGLKSEIKKLIERIREKDLEIEMARKEVENIEKKWEKEFRTELQLRLDHLVSIRRFLLEDGGGGGGGGGGSGTSASTGAGGSSIGNNRSKVDFQLHKQSFKDSFSDIVLRRVVKFLENEKAIIED